jgi:hypothetical protein
MSLRGGQARKQAGAAPPAPELRAFREALSAPGIELLSKREQSDALAPPSHAVAPRAPVRTEQGPPSSTLGLHTFGRETSKFGFAVPAGRDVTKAWERKSSGPPARGFVTMFRGDPKPRSTFLSKLALKEGEDASNAAIAKARSDGTMSTLFENHALTSTDSPFVSVTKSQSEAEKKAKGESGQQRGHVTKFNLPEDLPQPNFENHDADE